MGDLKAIETLYKGYRFRSRLEARWAVFLDTLNLKWAYEEEGYALEDAGWYLPDFHVEIGAYMDYQAAYFMCGLRAYEQERHMMTKEKQEKWDSLNWVNIIEQETQKFTAMPSKYFIEIKAISATNGEREKARALSEKSNERVYIFAGLPGAHEFDSGTMGTMPEYAYINGKEYPGNWFIFAQCSLCEKAVLGFGNFFIYRFCSCRKGIARMDLLIENAQNKAKQARFEHGENGASDLIGDGDNPF